MQLAKGSWIINGTVINKEPMHGQCYIVHIEWLQKIGFVSSTSIHITVEQAIV